MQFHSCASDSCNLAHLSSDYLCLISIAVKTLVFPAAGNLNSPVLLFVSKLIAVKSLCFHFKKHHLLRQGDSRPCKTPSYCYCTLAGLTRAPDKQNNKIVWWQMWGIMRQAAMFVNVLFSLAEVEEMWTSVLNSLHLGTQRILRQGNCLRKVLSGA